MLCQDDVWWLVGGVDGAVVVGAQHVHHMALTASLCEDARERQRLVFRGLQRLGELVDLYLLFLATISVGNIEHGKERDEQKQPHLPADGLGIENVATKNGAQGERGRVGLLIFACIFLDHLFQARVDLFRLSVLG